MQKDKTKTPNDAIFAHLHRHPLIRSSLSPIDLRTAIGQTTAMQPAAPLGRRLQDWTNKNVFAASVDSIDLPSQTRYQASANDTIDEGPEIELSAVEAVADPHTGCVEPITAFQAAWNVTNAIQRYPLIQSDLPYDLPALFQGMFIVGLPEAVAVGGWWTVLALIGVAYICYWTGLLLIDCLYEDGKKVRTSYREVADACRPGLGRFVLMAQLTELLSTCIIYLVLAGDLLQVGVFLRHHLVQGCVSSVDNSAWMLFTAALLVPCALLDSIATVSQLSAANAVSHLIVNAVMLVYCLSEIGNWGWSDVRFRLNIATMPTMMGVVVFGYTSHIFLPSLEGSMEDPKQFKPMLCWSHIAAAAFKSIFGLVGFLTFREFTQDEISNSLPNQSFKVLINLVLVVKALFSYPLPFFATVQLLTENFFKGEKAESFSSCYGLDRTLREWAVCLRIFVVLFTVLMALSVPYLLLLMGLIGNITGTMLSFIWPCYFHLKLKEHSLTDRERRFDRAVIGGGILIGIVGIYYSAAQLANAMRLHRR